MVGILFVLLAVGLLARGLSVGHIGGGSHSVLDSSEASGRMLATMMPVVLFGAIGFWMLLSQKQA